MYPHFGNAVGELEKLLGELGSRFYDMIEVPAEE